VKLATLKNKSLDGQLVVVSKDLSRYLDASHIAPNLQSAMENWNSVLPKLETLYETLQKAPALGIPLLPKETMAPLPRCFQWCDGSAFLNHGRLMEQAYNLPPIPNADTIPLVYQGASDDFLGCCNSVPFPDEAMGIDFEGEFGVIIGPIAMGVSSQEAHDAIRLIVQINDWSLRNFGPREMATGFGFIQAKPSCSFAPVAITPDELGEAWNNGRVELNLNVHWNGDWFGSPNGSEMNFSFGEIISHITKTRRLSAGTIIGSGTVSNISRTAGSACISERRVIEMIDKGKPETNFMKFGDTVRMEARNPSNNQAPFGAIEQQVIKA
jgi:fumarylacetoacetate (FAA) hydrolase